jgi:hypothetical protein
MLTLVAPRAADDLVRELESRGLAAKLETIDGKSGGWATDLAHELATPPTR